MTIPNRTVSIAGVFAADATTTIPQTPVSGISYRNAALTSTAVREGWAYKTIVDSANFNEALYEYSSVTAQVEKYGFLPWSNLTDYVEGSVCLGSNGRIYQAKQATGPSSTAYDPTTNQTVWDPVTLGVTEFLFHHVWSEYILNRDDWLRADTFSWQPGGTYENAYNHLVADIAGVSSTTETIGSYTITYYQAADGHRICLPDQETTLSNIYSESGVAWYYILDTANTRFKLPRENPAREELIQVVRAKGDGKALGLTCDGYNFGVVKSNQGNTTNAMESNTVVYGQSVGTYGGFNIGGYYAEHAIGITTDSTKSGIISDMTDSTSVYKGKQYLYFYVGQFTQTATEQTAGLNSELFNGKLDLDLGNITNTSKETIVGWGMPDYSSGVSFSTPTSYADAYEVTTNGIYTAFCQGNNTSRTLYINNSATNFIADSASAGSGRDSFTITVLLKKGDKIHWSGTFSSSSHVFYPCIGG